jgi:hypothetical protein
MNFTAVNPARSIPLAKTPRARVGRALVVYDTTKRRNTRRRTKTDENCKIVAG